MSAVEKIKKQATQCEHYRQYERALALYTRLLDEPAPGDEEVDVALYNRAGDLALRAGDQARAVRWFERAIDLYAAGGFLNNAIALGVKLLRHAPGQVAAHYTLGVLYAKKGFRSDARHHLLEYADRMHRGGHDGEATRALGEYAALCFGADDARAGLEAHLAKAPVRAGEVGRRLATLLDGVLGAPAAEAPAAPPAVPNAAETAPEATAPPAPAGQLVFLDIGDALFEPPAVGGATAAGGQGDAPAVATAAGLLTAFDFGLDDAAGEAGPAASEPVVGDAVGAFAGGAIVPDAIGPDALDVDPLPIDAPAPPAGPVTDAGTTPAELELIAWEPPAGEPALDWLVPAAQPTGRAPTAAERADDLEGELPPLVVAVLDRLPAAGEAAPGGELEVGAERPEAPTFEVCPPEPDEEALDLGAWLRATEEPRSTRLVTAAAPPTGNEDADFAATLGAFKAGVARVLDDADYESHYDLGVAYREMGLLDEAIGEFQKAARAPGQPLRPLEALAEAFLERGDPGLARTALDRVARAIEARTEDAGEHASLVGLCYLLGAATERLGEVAEARRWYARVLATDLHFRDAARRLALLPPHD